MKSKESQHKTQSEEETNLKNKIEAKFRIYGLEEKVREQNKQRKELEDRYEREKKELKDEILRERKERKEQEDKYEKEKNEFKIQIKEFKDEILRERNERKEEREKFEREREKFEKEKKELEEKYQKIFERERRLLMKQAIKPKDDEKVQNEDTEHPLQHKKEIKTDKKDLSSELHESNSNLSDEEEENTQKLRGDERGS